MLTIAANELAYARNRLRRLLTNSNPNGNNRAIAGSGTRVTLMSMATGAVPEPPGSSVLMLMKLPDGPGLLVIL